MSKLEFRYKLYPFDPVTVKKNWHVENTIEGDFQIVSGGDAIFEQPSVSLVEFAFDAIRWLDQLSESPCDFVYMASDADEDEFISVERLATGWQVGAAWQSKVDKNRWTLGEVRQALSDYVAQLRAELLRDYGIDIMTVYSLRRFR